MKRDKSIDDLHERIDKVESNTAAPDSNDDKFKIDKYDDGYYLDIDSEPPRNSFANGVIKVLSLSIIGILLVCA